MEYGLGRCVHEENNNISIIKNGKNKCRLKHLFPEPEFLKLIMTLIFNLFSYQNGILSYTIFFD